MSSSNGRVAASFRDPSGFLFTREGELYRQVNQAYQGDYDLLMSSGLYAHLVKNGLLIPHEETAVEPALPELSYRVIRPERVGFISYPYEWSFGQLKAAALATLRIQQQAYRFGMSLKDASAYNIQFHKGRPVLIDTLSFEKARAGEPWVAYRQFCQHFLAPLVLMAHTDVRLSQLMRVYIDGVPLDLASSLLPWKTRLTPGLLTHIHLHAGAQKRYAGQAVGQRPQVSEMAFLGLLDNLISTVRGLDWKAQGTEWGAYYEGTNYSKDAFEQKRRLVESFLQQVQPQVVWDLGANNGEFSRVASEMGAQTVAFDIDPAAVEQNYRQVVEKKETRLLPLVLDLTNPSPAMGWANDERGSLVERGPADAVLALALIHHLAISNNVPLLQVAEFFARCARWLVIEFVPKSDSQVQRLLASRADIFPNYTREGFEAAFNQVYAIRRVEAIPGSERWLYLMERLED